MEIHELCVRSAYYQGQHAASQSKQGQQLAMQHHSTGHTAVQASYSGGPSTS